MSHSVCVCQRVPRSLIRGRCRILSITHLLYGPHGNTSTHPSIRTYARTHARTHTTYSLFFRIHLRLLGQIPKWPDNCVLVSSCSTSNRFLFYDDIRRKKYAAVSQSVSARNIYFCIYYVFSRSFSFPPLAAVLFRGMLEQYSSIGHTRSTWTSKRRKKLFSFTRSQQLSACSLDVCSMYVRTYVFYSWFTLVSFIFGEKYTYNIMDLLK